MKLSTIIIDDEPIALEKMKSYVAKTPFLTLAGEFSNAGDALDFLASEHVDLVFTDINMPDLNGMDMTSAMPGRPMTVFVTAYSDYAVDSYRVGAVDYLLKPYTFADFTRAATRALDQATAHRSGTTADTSASSPAPLFIKTDYRHVRVDPDTIDYIKGYGEYLQIYIAGARQPLVTLSSFARIRDSLPASFMQVHRSYLVNMHRVTHVERGRIITGDGAEIPVGDSYKAPLADYLDNHTPSRPRKLT